MKTPPIAAAVIAACALIGACKKKLPEVAAPAADNSATRYVGGLQHDVQKAQEAAAKATQNIGTTQSGVNQAVDPQ